MPQNPYHVNIQCQAPLPNKMRCPNPAVIEKTNDPEHKTSLCAVHAAAAKEIFKAFLDSDEKWINLPDGSAVDSTKVVEAQSQSAENTLGAEIIHDDKIGG